MNDQSLTVDTKKEEAKNSSHMKRMANAEKNGWILKFPAHPTYKKASHILRVGELTDGSEEYALYKLSGDSFSLVDFFTDLSFACDEARETILKSEKYGRVFSSGNTAK
ncbi:TPA: hypothetical protein KNG84_001095 [Serratia fonticola]|nr:hypothetical protein [Serratia fonticola]